MLILRAAQLPKPAQIVSRVLRFFGRIILDKLD